MKRRQGNSERQRNVKASYVESGIFEMTIGSDVKIIRQGDGYYVPPHAVHGCVCLEEGMLADAFSHARQGFLPDIKNIKNK